MTRCMEDSGNVRWIKHAGDILMSVTTPHIAHSIEELPGGYMSWMLQPEHLLHKFGVKTR